MQDEISSKLLTALYYTAQTTTVCSAWRWLTKPKHVADKVLIVLCLNRLVFMVLLIASEIQYSYFMTLMQPLFWLFQN